MPAAACAVQREGSVPKRCPMGGACLRILCENEGIDRVRAMVRPFRENMSRRSLIGSPARTALKDVNIRVNDDQAEKAARRMSVYPIKGGLGDRAAPTTPFKSPFKSGAHMREFTSATPGAAQTLSPSRLGDLYQNCIKLSNENVSAFLIFHT